MPFFGPPNTAQLEAKRDVQGLIKTLAYKDSAIRIAAADALAPIGDPLAVEPLVALLVSAFPRVDPLEQSEIVAALAELGWQPGEPDTIAARKWPAAARPKPPR